MADTGTPSLESRAAGGTDPGAVDNRLSLDPNNPRWKKIIADWEDGGEYSATVNLNQISPGEFEVTGFEADDVETPEEEAAPEEESDAEAEMPAKGIMEKPNRAVRGMMAEEG